MTIYQAPGVYLKEVDLSQRIDGAATSIGAVVFESKKGPLAPTLITGGRNQFLDLYGFPDPSVSFGHDTALAFLRQSGALYCKRVVNGALYSGLIFYQDKEISPTRTLYTQFPQGLSESYLSGNHKLALIRIEDKLVSGNSLSVNISNGVTTEAATTTYATSNNATLSAFAAAIQTKLNTFAQGGLATVVNETAGTPIKTQLRLAFSAAFVTSNTINGSISINGATPVAITPVTYNTSSINTMNALAQAFITAGAGNAYIESGSNNLNLIIESPVGGVNTITLSAIAVTGGASQATATISTVKTGSGINDNRIITVIFPTTASLFLDSFNLSGVGAPSGSIEENVELFEVFTENPGSWGNNIGVSISNIDVGVNQRHSLTISTAFVTNNSISGLINNTTVGPVAFSTDSDTTLANLATAIQNHLISTYGSGSAVVTSIPNSLSNDREIIVTSPNSTTTLILKDFIVSGGASQPQVTITEILKNIPTTNTFSLQVFDKSNISTPLESFTVSLKEQNDGFGTQQNISEVINKSGVRSSYIRIAQQTPILSTNVLKSGTPAVIFLNGGADGSVATSAQLKAGWAEFEDSETYDVRILMNAGYYDPSVQQTIVNLAESRGDCIAVLDAPSSAQTTQSLLNYRNNTLNIDSSFGAFYAPDLLIVDDFTNTQRFVPPSGYVAAQYAYTDTVAETWFAPAGLNRGNIDNIIGLRQKYQQKTDIELLYPKQINSIIQKAGVGFIIWGARTLQSKSSALSYVNVRRLLCIISVSLQRAINWSVFEPNDDFTRAQITDLIESFLKPIQDKRGLQSFEVVADSRNNKSTDIDAGQLNVDVYLSPTIPAEKINIRLIVTKSGVTAADLNL